jgi:NAD(P)-dependent dehydrogenase (short-subunit alcohol dehydrogenase family)
MDSVLISGANRGIGLEFARQYAAEGWHVYATARNPEEAAGLRHFASAERRARLYDGTTCAFERRWNQIYSSLVQSAWLKSP